MHVVIGNHHLSSIGGAETYMVTVAEQLTRFGHRVTIYGSDEGELAAHLRERRLAVAIGQDALPRTCDAVIAQDAVSSLELAERFPSVQQLFVAHCGHLEMWYPPNLPGVVGVVVAMNDRIRTRLEALAGDHELIRMRQPVDIGRFSPREPIRSRPERVLALGNYLIGHRRQALADACEALGLELLQIGRHARHTFEPEHAIRTCDVVVGHGRSVLEGMSCGVAAYVYDQVGADGWVTPDSYAALEADGFAGTALPNVVDPEALAEDLARWRPQMGPDNRDLIRRDHSALEHTAELVRLLKSLAPRRRTAGSAAGELARLARSQWYAEGAAASLRVENAVLRRQLVEARAAAEEARSRLARFEAQVAAFKRTRRYRLAQLQARPLDALRRGVTRPRPAERDAAPDAAPATRERASSGSDRRAPVATGPVA
ncbi:MAG: hypothetical protein QOG41_1072 [Thermoleophilaceae bacterium]|nr:hypothetical protein [Thermoleophilaceae bacterium]